MQLLLLLLSHLLEWVAKVYLEQLLAVLDYFFLLGLGLSDLFLELSKVYLLASLVLCLLIQLFL